MPKSRGRNASRNGAYNEQSFTSLLDCAGVQYDSQFLFKHPWGKKGYSDVLITSRDSRIIVVQNKNQNVSGTCDEKIPFQFDIARWMLGEFLFHEFWMVLGGTYWSTTQGTLRVEAYERKAAEFRMFCPQTKAYVFMQPSPELTLAIRGCS